MKSMCGMIVFSLLSDLFNSVYHTHCTVALSGIIVFCYEFLYVLIMNIPLLIRGSMRNSIFGLDLLGICKLLAMSVLAKLFFASYT